MKKKPQRPEADPLKGRDLSHLEPKSGPRRRSRMVDVGLKPSTERLARACALLEFPRGLLVRVLSEGGPKGPIEEVARCAGILAAKRTSELIPMCHGLPLDHVQIDFEAIGTRRLRITCEVRCRAATGVEMEALTGAAVAALTVYDMVKALGPGVVQTWLGLVHKQGGQSGDYSVPAPR